MRKGVIYKLTAPNNKVYIGQTRMKMKARLQKHAAQARKGKKRPFTSAKARRNMSIAQMGKTLSKEHRQKVAEGVRRYWERKKLAEQLLRKKQPSAEAKQTTTT
tara:strand:- start:111 stop:422 length:312 start_codon:yes stop_codon:yes gene_type:complete